MFTPVFLATTNEKKLSGQGLDTKCGHEHQGENTGVTPTHTHTHTPLLVSSLFWEIHLCQLCLTSSKKKKRGLTLVGRTSHDWLDKGHLGGRTILECCPTEIKNTRSNQAHQRERIRIAFRVWACLFFV